MWIYAVQLFNPYGHDNLFTYLHTTDREWKVVRKAFAKSMSAERIRYCSSLCKENPCLSALLTATQQSMF